MSRDAVVLLALVLSSGSWALCHLWLLLRVVRARELPWWTRALGLVPVATPVVAALAGARALPVCWLVLGVAYVALRSMA